MGNFISPGNPIAPRFNIRRLETETNMIGYDYEQKEGHDRAMNDRASSSSSVYLNLLQNGKHQSIGYTLWLSCKSCSQFSVLGQSEKNPVCPMSWTMGKWCNMMINEGIPGFPRFWGKAFWWVHGFLVTVGFGSYHLKNGVFEHLGNIPEYHNHCFPIT